MYDKPQNMIHKYKSKILQKLSYRTDWAEIVRTEDFALFEVNSESNAD